MMYDPSKVPRGFRRIENKNVIGTFIGNMIEVNYYPDSVSKNLLNGCQ